jgi:hypothetical protein
MTTPGRPCLWTTDLSGKKWACGDDHRDDPDQHERRKQA